MSSALVPDARPVFQSDQCFNDRKLCDKCNAEGLVRLLRFPGRLMGKNDPEILADLLPRGNPFVTSDKALPEEHSEKIPAQHPGIIVICFSPEVKNKTLRSADMQRILASFKQRIGQWHRLLIRNSIIFISESRIEVFHAEQKKIKQDLSKGFDESNWIDEFLGQLQVNSGIQDANTDSST